MKPAAVVFGAGKAACGLLGQVLFESGYETTFVARRSEVIAAINHRGGYTLIEAGRRLRTVAVGESAALNIADSGSVARAIAEAEVLFTAVGADNLPAIAPAIAAGLARRAPARGPLNVIACENLPGAGAYLAHQVLSAAGPNLADLVQHVGGFTAALTRRIMTGGAIERGELTFTVDAPIDLVIDRTGLKGSFAPLAGAEVTGDFGAAVMRKLFTINLAQAVAAYLGYQAGCTFVHEAAAHPAVAGVVRGALDEATEALIAAFPAQQVAIRRDADEALARIANDRLADPISRVARDPRRKLSPRERLVGAARLAGQFGLPTVSLSRAIAAALLYDDPGDPQAAAMQRDIQAESIDKVLTEDCGLLPYDVLSRAVKGEWLDLSSAKRRRSQADAGTCVREIIAVIRADLGSCLEEGLVNRVLGLVKDEIRRQDHAARGRGIAFAAGGGGQ